MQAEKARFRSLTAKLVAIYVPLVVSVILTLFVVLEVRFYNSERDRLVDDLKSLVSVQDTAFAAAVWEFDEGRIAKLLADLNDLPVLQGAAVYDLSGETLGLIGDVLSEPEEVDFRIDRPLVYSGGAVEEVAGRLEIIVHSNKIWKDVGDHIKTNALILLFIIIAIITVTVIATEHVVGKPLVRLRMAMENAKIKKVHEAVDWNSADELGQVVHAYNEMQAAQASAEKDLQDHQAHLEYLVAERTEKLADNETRIRTLLEVSPIGFNLVRLDGMSLMVNEAAARIYGLTIEEIRNWDVLKFYQNPEDRERYLKTLRREGAVSGFDVAMKKKDGTPLWVTFNAKLVDFDGKEAIMTWVDDITERKKSEAELAEKEEQLSSAISNMPSGIIMIDKDMTIQLFNDRYVELYEMPEGVLRVGGSLKDMIRVRAERGDYGPGDPEELISQRVNGYGGGDLQIAENTVPSGRILELIRNPSEDGSLVAICSDITDRKLAEAELNRQKNISETVLENIGQGVTMFDDDLNIMAFNETLIEMLDLPAGEFKQGQPFEQWIRFNAGRGEYGDGDIDELVRERVELAKKFEAHHFERRLRDGRYLEVNGRPVDGGGFVSIYTDITERKQAEQTLQGAYDIISGSIEYASRIQRSVLPDEELIRHHLADYFIIWEPRDQVGGDIYWCRTWGDGFLIMLGDCTGHGIPGAFMTLIATGALDRALEEIPPGEIGRVVRRMHRYVQNTLGQDTEGGKSDEGLELGACYLDAGKTEMIYSGARFSLFTLDDDEIQEIKGDKKGIGYRNIPYDQEFTNQKVELKPDRVFYMTSDGLIDQVGGERRRSFGKRRFKEMIISLKGRGLTEQKFDFMEALHHHQGSEPRRDDVSVIAFKI